MLTSDVFAFICILKHPKLSCYRRRLCYQKSENRKRGIDKYFLYIKSDFFDNSPTLTLLDITWLDTLLKKNCFLYALQDGFRERFLLLAYSRLLKKSTIWNCIYSNSSSKEKISSCLIYLLPYCITTFLYTDSMFSWYERQDTNIMET